MIPINKFNYIKGANTIININDNKTDILYD